MHWRLAGGGLPLARRRHLFLIAMRRIGWRLRVDTAPVFKRTLDLVGASLFLIALTPLFGLVALAILLEDGRPLFFRQVRVGKDGRLFSMYKFRSMVRNAEALKADLMTKNEMPGGVIFKIRRDPRVTRVGRLCRRFSIDELPQLLNVVRGEMSLVGPRPPLPSEVALYDAAHRRRLLATPGITCLWQVSGRSNIDFVGQVRLDGEYIERQTLIMDIAILLRTLPAVLTGKGAS
jgi:lipopolysaccharide/colanic/teichoic acid biosynthesis glycosyltransferase